MTTPRREDGVVRVLVVDDSAVVRRALSSILEGARAQVTTAADPFLAMQEMRRSGRPDVILLDIEMPRMDGLTFLRHIMASEDPIPVLICSHVAGPGTDRALQALDEGAVGIVAKPRLAAGGFADYAAQTLVATVQDAARVERPLRRRGSPASPLAPAARPRPTRTRTASPPAGRRSVIAIGASTGGPEALRAILPSLPEDAPAIVVVQHMPEVFTAAFARRLSALCAIEVREARDGDRLEPGLALIAAGNRHLEVRGGGGEYLVRVSAGPPVSGHRPSVDVLFRSVQHAVGADAIGVLLSGMGRDGAEGLLALRRAGARTVAQDEASCVVFGMPGAAVALGAACEVVPLPMIAAAVLGRGH